MVCSGGDAKVAKVGPPRARFKSAKVPPTPYAYYPPAVFLLGVRVVLFLGRKAFL